MRVYRTTVINVSFIHDFLLTKLGKNVQHVRTLKYSTVTSCCLAKTEPKQNSLVHPIKSLSHWTSVTETKMFSEYNLKSGKACHLLMLRFIQLSAYALALCTTASRFARTQKERKIEMKSTFSKILTASIQQTTICYYIHYKLRVNVGK